jgi:hypothetical protein
LAWPVDPRGDDENIVPVRAPSRAGARPVPTQAWEQYPNPDFRDRLATAEDGAVASRPDFGYRKVNPVSGALGRYQMKRDALREAGMLDAHGNWTGKYSINSGAEFLANPDAQEKALTNLLQRTERQLQANGAFDFIGTNVDGLVGQFTITRAGLIAAAHRQGARATSEYLGRLDGVGYDSHRLLARSPEELAIETRLRTFADAPYE